MALKFNFIKNLIEDGDVALKKIHTSKNPAEILTKAIPLQKFEHALAMAMIDGDKEQTQSVNVNVEIC